MEFCDLNKQYEAYKQEIDDAIQGVIQSSAFINGKAIDDFERNLEKFSGAKHAIACSSGTDALLLPLMAYDIQPGDEVLCPAFSFIASASMVSLYKAKPVFVDVSPLDFNIDVKKIEEKISPRTRGIIAVSLYGQCADMDAINAIAKRHKLWVIEDAAQSFGATYKGKKSCNLSDVGTTSFFPAKPLGGYGDGGAVFTSNDQLAEKMRMLRSHGQIRRYMHQLIGLNARMDTIQAAILDVKLKYFDQEIIKRQEAAGWYSELLSDKLLLPEIMEGRSSVWAQYTIGLAQRDEVQKKLREKNIPSTVHYPVPLPRQTAFKAQVETSEEFEVSNLLSQTVLSLPMHGFITRDEVETVALTINEILHD